MYPKDYAGMQSELGKLEAKNDYLCRAVTPEIRLRCQHIAQNQVLEVLNRIEGRVGARWVDVVLVKA